MTKKLLSLSVLFSFLGLALITPASAETNAPESKHVKPTIDLICMQNAVAKRDNAVISSFDAYHTSLKTSFEKRRDGQIVAWKIEEKKERVVALKNVWTTFGKERVAAHYDYYKSRIASWNTFRTERKACGARAVIDDVNTPVMINE